MVQLVNEVVVAGALVPAAQPTHITSLLLPFFVVCVWILGLVVSPPQS